MTFELQTAAICCILALAAGFKSVTGFGFSLCAAPLLALILVPERSVPILVLIETAVGVWLWLQMPIRIRVKQLLFLCAASIVGMLAGTALLKYLNPEWLRIVLGVAVLFTVAALWSGRRIPLNSSRAGVGLTGLLSGLLGGTTAMSGPPIILFFDANTPGPVQFRANCIAYFTITYAVQALWLTWQEMITADVLRETVPGLALVMLILWLSRTWHLRIDSATFRKLSLSLLAVGGASATLFGAVQLMSG